MNEKKSWRHIHLNMPVVLLEKVDKLIERGEYLTRTDFINDAVARRAKEVSK